MSDPATFKASGTALGCLVRVASLGTAQDGHLTRGPCDRRIVAGERGGDYAARGKSSGLQESLRKKSFLQGPFAAPRVCEPSLDGLEWVLLSAAWSGSLWAVQPKPAN